MALSKTQYEGKAKPEEVEMKLKGGGQNEIKREKKKKTFHSVLHQKAGIPLPQLLSIKEEVARIIF